MAAARGWPWLLLAVIIGFPLFAGNYLTDVGITVFIYAMLALGLNIVVGYAGLLDLGYAALFAIGAYTSALLSLRFGLNFWETLPLAIVAASIAGVIIGYPTLRLRSDYLAIVTLGFGEIVRDIVTNLNVTGGPNGLYGIPSATVAKLQLATTREFFYLALGFMLLILWFNWRLSRWRIRRAWESVRQDEAAAEAVGIPTLRVKLAAYLCGAAIAGLVGPLFAARFGAISPTSFTYLVSVTILIVVVLGGRGSTRGVLLGAIVVEGLPEALRFLQLWREFIFALLLIGLMLLRPQGLWPAARVRRDPFVELAEDAQPLQPESLSLNSIGALDRTPLLRLESLTCRFGGVTAVDNLTLDIRRNEILSIIGPNGAGKTTAFNCITGVARPSSGRIVLAGRVLTGLAPHRVVALGVARTFQGIRLFREMTAYENVLVGMYATQRTDVWGLFSERRQRANDARDLQEVRYWMRFAGVWERRMSLATELPYGLQRRLEITRALASRPALLLLDEPAAGMNPTEKLEVIELVRRIRDLGITVVLIEHDMELVTQLAERVICMDRGRILAEGTPAVVQADPGVVEAYLGAAGDDEFSFDDIDERSGVEVAWDS